MPRRQDPRAMRLVFGDVAQWAVEANIAPGDRIEFKHYAGRGMRGPEYVNRTGTVHLVGPQGPVVTLPGDKYGASPVVVTRDKFVRVVSRKRGSNPRRKSNRVTGLSYSGIIGRRIADAKRHRKRTAHRRRMRRNPAFGGMQVVGPNMTEVQHGQIKALYSYNTPVALTAPSGLYRTEKQWSNTTSRHISKWFGMMGLDAKGAKRIPQDELARAVIEGVDPAKFGHNPTLAIVGANPPRGRYLGHVKEVRYIRHGGQYHGQRFKHAFKPGAKLYAMPDGSIRIC